MGYGSLRTPKVDPDLTWFVMHIGLEKPGSTVLQSTLDCNRRVLADHGIDFTRWMVGSSHHAGVRRFIPGNQAKLLAPRQRGI